MRDVIAYIFNPDPSSPRKAEDDPWTAAIVESWFSELEKQAATPAPVRPGRVRSARPEGV